MLSGLQPSGEVCEPARRIARNKPFMGSATLDRPSMGEPKLREKKWEPAYEEDVLKAWRAEPDLYRFSPEPGQPTYVIDTPPPYPSGSWHVGALLAYAVIGLIAPAQRMLRGAGLFS